MTRIKICGITSLDDALTSIEFGADALGFVFADSPRQIDPETAHKIIRVLPPFIDTVGVFVDEKVDVIQQTANHCGLHSVQLHGNESPSYVQKLSLPLIKAFRIRDISDVEDIKRFELTHFLLDTYDEHKSGGTGKSFDWEIALPAKALGEIILSGGLNSSNITDALESVKPYAVDVSSGVEKSPGIKDHRKIEEFIRKVRTWDNRTN
ncbi:MAG: phosphoribosylanthranilate isomerase [FCB group bacterium]|nr:phosphoribosylanthranilate isomerase [FCB group bacterium]